MPDRPFRFGVVAGYAPDIQAVTSVARRAEELGFDTLVTPDPMGAHDPLTVLSGVAAVTSRLRFGTFVLAEAFRDKRMLSWQAQTLHNLSGGRFELGLGTGRPGSEQFAAELGRDFGSPGERVAGVAELVAELKAQEDRPRLLLAGAGPKLLGLAAREADIVTFTWKPQTTEAEAASIVDRFRETAGARFDEIELNINLIAVGDELPTQMQKYIGMSSAELAAAGAVTVLPGTAAENADVLRRWRDELGISYISVNSGFLEKFAPIVEMLSGS
ncbi:LLM class flavin-dependent oxidoreductase [Amycolatopsis nigrescens]|uniref:LLM class flavin-dependent oxidoreductase n=1 Tax=Amycolatopsis nigrescens TaxID=381445 RepID=UPI0003644ECD|nr:LLM class flavin-dependent oxidoreductase [Amycolatopsis nigrescens]